MWVFQRRMLYGSGPTLLLILLVHGEDELGPMCENWPRAFFIKWVLGTDRFQTGTANIVASSYFRTRDLPWAFLLHFKRLAWMKPPKPSKTYGKIQLWSSIGAMVKKKRPAAESATAGLEDLLGDGPEEQELSVSQRLGWTSFFVKTLLKHRNGTEFLPNFGLKSQPSGSMPRNSMRRWTRSRRHELPRFWAARRDAIVLNICVYIYIHIFIIFYFFLCHCSRLVASWGPPFRLVPGGKRGNSWSL